MISSTHIGSPVGLAGAGPLAIQGQQRAASASSSGLPGNIHNEGLPSTFDLTDQMLQHEDQLYRCWDRTEGRSISDARRFALCLANAAVSQCDVDDDPWCAESVRRTVAAKAAPVEARDPLSADSATANHRALGALLARAGLEFSTSSTYEDALMSLEIEFNDLTGFEPTIIEAPLTAHDLLQILMDSDSGEVAIAGAAAGQSPVLVRFEQALREQGIVLHRTMRTIAQEHIQSEPEHYAEALQDQLERWLDQRYPKATDMALGRHRRHVLLGLLADRINARLSARAPAGGP